MIRRAHARRAGETIAVEQVVLRLEVATSAILEPVPTLTTAVLAPALDVRDAVADIDVETREPDVFAGVDVVPLRLVGNQVAVRSPTMRIRRPAERVVAPLTTEARAGGQVMLAPPTCRTATPAPLELVRRSATPAATLDESWLRGALLRLYRASRLPSPGDLELVGIYERVPGGAIASVALDADGIVLRIHPRLRPHPATLLVGRGRGTAELLPVEVEPPAGRNITPARLDESG